MLPRGHFIDSPQAAGLSGSEPETEVAGLESISEDLPVETTLERPGIRGVTGVRQMDPLTRNPRQRFRQGQGIAGVVHMDHPHPSRLALQLDEIAALPHHLQAVVKPAGIVDRKNGPRPGS